MGSNGGGYIVTSLGPVAVAPLPPFEWQGVQNINVGRTEMMPLEPAMVVSGVSIYHSGDKDCFFELYLQGKNLTPEQFNGQTLNITTDDGSIYVGTMGRTGVDPDGTHKYDVTFRIDYNKFTQMTSYRFSPPDKAFEVTCVDLIKT